MKILTCERFNVIEMWIRRVFLCLFVMFFGSCKMFSATATPYQISGEFVMEEDSEKYKNAGFEFNFTNMSTKRVKSFTLVFFLFDEDGEPPLGVKNNIVLSITRTVESGQTVEGCISLDKYIYTIPEYPYEIDYLYVSQINYDDGSVWKDPLGFISIQ